MTSRMSQKVALCTDDANNHCIHHFKGFVLPILLRMTLLMFLLSAHGVKAYEVDYQIQADEALETLKVKVCFAEKVPKALYNGAWEDNRWLKSVLDAKGYPLRVADNEMRLEGVKSHQCISYQSRIASDKSRRRSNYRSGTDLVINNNTWLWQPKDLGANDKIKLTFNLAKGYNVSTPWPLLDKAKNQFMLTQTPYDWDSRIAIGRFSVKPIKVARQTLQVAILNASAKRKAEYIDWIRQVAGAIAGLNGDFPLDNAQILITPIGARREAVPWGEVQRGGSTSAHFFVDSFRPIQEFKDDWTAAHELSHMLVPFINRDELWLSEGIASYYQNVARAKAGMISPQKGWSKLLAGFSRGTKAAKKESLSNSSAIMQMYWGGAALYMMADAQLRKQSNNQQSVATVLSQFNRCCRPSITRWSGLKLMLQFDKISGTKIFSRLYYSEAQQRRFPDIMPVLKALGFDELKIQEGHQLNDRAMAMMK
ncbi:MAG: hypothetical protein ACI9FJ_000380 [Alteromonadaceae bacterium]|jgi:hypothetical protein